MSLCTCAAINIINYPGKTQNIFKRDRHIAKRGLLASSCPPVRPSSRNNSAANGRICLKFGVWSIFSNLSREFKFHWNLKRTTDTLHEYVFTFMIIYGWIILRMRNVYEKSCRRNQNTFFIFSKFFVSKIVPVWDKVLKYSTAGLATDDDRAHACYVLNNQGYKRSLRICNTYCLSTEKVVKRTCINIRSIRTLLVLLLSEHAVHMSVETFRVWMTHNRIYSAAYLTFRHRASSI